VRVYYADTDAGGVVYHANYLHFMERARNEWLRDMGHPIADIARKLNLIFVLKHVDISYKAPAKLDDLLSITAQVMSARRASMVIEQQVRLADRCLVLAKLTLLVVDADTFKPRPLPDFLTPAAEAA